MRVRCQSTHTHTHTHTRMHANISHPQVILVMLATPDVSAPFISNTAGLHTPPAQKCDAVLKKLHDPCMSGLELGLHDPCMSGLELGLHDRCMHLTNIGGKEGGGEWQK